MKYLKHILSVICLGTGSLLNAAETNTDPSVLLLDLLCNGESTSQIIYALKDESGMWVPEEVLSACRVVSKPKLTRMVQNKRYYSLEDKSILIYFYDPALLSLNVLVPSRYLPKNTINLNAPNLRKIRPQMPGTYINYDISLQRDDFINQNHTAAVAETVYFNDLGVGDLQFLLQNAGYGDPLVRLNTNWTYDQPEKMATLRMGDSITGTAIWSGAVQFGGLQYATNFGTQPGFVPFPLPGFKGEAVVPTTVEFYLENQLRASSQVSNGPYDIQGLSVVTGAGDLVVQTKDILGRRTVAILPYYINQQFLQEGLTSFSYETGFIRNNFGLESNDYSHFLLVGSFQEGLTNDWTAGWHAELQSKQKTIGVSSNYIVDKLFQVAFATAVSHSTRGNGGLLLAGIQRQTLDYNVGLQFTTTTENFQQLGLQEDALAPQLLLQSNASYADPYWGTIAASYTVRLGRTEEDIKLTTISYNKSIFKNIFFTTSYLYQQDQQNSNSYFASFVWSPKVNYTSTLSYQHSPGQNGVTASFAKNLPSDNGYGYRILGNIGDNSRLEADYALQTDYGLYQAIFSRIENTNNIELDASGAIGLFSGYSFISRRIDGSFILAHLPGQAKVRIYKSNLLMGKTNRDGYFLIPQTLPYDENVISFNPIDLPLNTQFQTDKMIAYPYFRSGAYLRFPIRTVMSASFHLRLSNHQPVPSGAFVWLDNSDNKYPVGYDGSVFISELSLASVITGGAKWGNHVCRFSIPVNKRDEIINYLGQTTCVANH